MVNLAQRHKSVSSGLVRFLKSILARFVLKVDADEAAAALAKEVARKAKDAERAKARREKRKVESADSKRESADSPKESADASADSVFESADSAKTPEISTFVSAAHLRQRGLSLLSKNLDSQESESGRVPLPHDWGPNAKVRQFAIDRLGDERAADLCFAKFRVRHETSGERWTPREWQSRARGWVLLEEQFFGRQRSLPLLAPVPALAKADAVPGKVYLKLDSPQGEAWKRYAGKTFPRDRDGGWWFDREWPPDHDETRQAS